MIELIWLLFVFILRYSYVIPFVAAVIYMNRINLEKEIRYKQMLIPVFALLYCLVIGGLYDEIVELIIFIVNYLLVFISFLIDKINYFFNIGLLDNISKIISGLVNFDRTSHGYKLLEFTVMNPLIVLLFCYLKSKLLDFLDKEITGEEGSIIQKLNVFYEYDEDTAKWYIAENWGQAAEFMRYIRNVVVVLAVLMSMLVCLMYEYDGGISELFFPVYIVLLISELYFFFDGLEKNDAEDLEGQNDDARLIGNYSILCKRLKRLFGDKLLSENTSVDVLDSDIQTNDEVLTELEKSKDAMLEAYGIFMRKKVNSGMELEQSYLVSGKDLLEGKSIVFNNPFYYDLIPYIFYPMNRKLMQHKKVMLIIGRHDIEDDIVTWCSKGLTQITNLPDLWKIGILNDNEQNLDVGIVTRSCVHNLQMQENNKEFFENVGFVVLIEPSKLLATAQIGLNSLIRYCHSDENEVVYCSIDKNCDGIVDALSHILLTNLTEVSAINHHKGVSSYMCWDADGECLQHRILPNISRYLGMGTELGMIALKNQIPDVTWYGGMAFPVVDMHWIAKQYYYDLLKYAEIPATQEIIDKIFKCVPNLWNAKMKSGSYMVVEDETYNMFEMRRCFASRGLKQGFVNVLSTEYLLKDYMADNNELFQTDSKAIPYVAADYAHTRRNVALRLCIRMNTYMVSEQELKNELKLVCAGVKNFIDEFWHMVCECCQKIGESNYDENKKELLFFNRESEQFVFSSEIIRIKKKFSAKTMKMENFYFIDNEDFVHLVLDDLQSAEYIAEDEYDNHNYLGTELKGQIFQRHLPGQYLTFCGKYYEVVRQTTDGQLIVRRAADHINGRDTYRQNRNYIISNMIDSSMMGDGVKYSKIKIKTVHADIRVETPSYWKMNRHNDFVNGKIVEINGVPDRNYYNKQVLCMDFSEYEEISSEVLGTLAVLLNEVFRSIFAENQEFIVAVTPCCKIVQNTYNVREEKDGILNDKCIYFIEDSQMDIGLLIAVKRNLSRIFAIIYDYLDWHEQTLFKSMNPEPEPEKPSYVLSPEQQEEQAAMQLEKDRLHENIFKRIFASFKNNKIIKKLAAIFKAICLKIKNIFNKKHKNDVSGNMNSSDDNIKHDEMFNEPKEVENVASETDENIGTETVENVDADENIEFEADKAIKPVKFGERKPYHLRHYLLFGDLEEPEWLDIAGVKIVLDALGCSKNELGQARKGKKLAEEIEKGTVGQDIHGHYCDFCGRELAGTLYEELSDGRERCPACSRTAVRTEKEFIDMYHTIKKNLKIFFGININVPVQIKMVNAKRVHNAVGETFTPTSGCDARTLGVAIRKKGKYYILIENGAPRFQAMLTFVHELTHIWQYINWDDEEIQRKYGMDMELQVYEGMAEWTRIQYAYLLNEITFAKREEIMLRGRGDEYGLGFVKYAEVYPISEGTFLTGDIPFNHPHEPL